MELVKTLKEKAAIDAAKAETDWQALVTKLAAGENVTEREARNVLNSTGHSLDELEAAVTREQRITVLRAIVATLPDATRALEQSTSAETAFNVARQVEFAKNRDDGTVIRTEVLEARSNFDAIGSAQHELDSLVGTPVELPIGDV